MADLKSKKILLVDDQPENLQAIVDIFAGQEDSYTIFKAPNGKIALDIIQKILPDIIITDWEMPDMDGIDLLKSLKSNVKTTDIPVIMCTGVMTTSKNLQTALDAGAIDYIRKPIDEIELIARTKANLHLAEKYEEIKSLNHTKDKLFSIIAHDLRGPLNSITQLSELVKKSCALCMEDDAKTMIEYINVSSKNVRELLENLLQWAGSQTGDISYEPEIISLENIILKSIELSEQMATNKKVTINLETDTDNLVYIDKNMIRIVLINLLSNAIKFTNTNGKISVEVKTTTDFALVSIVDNGVGMSETMVNDMFRIDKKVSNRGTENEKGTGLGLILCKEFVENHGGEIWVESEEGKGSKFSFTVPYASPKKVR